MQCYVEYDTINNISLLNAILSLLKDHDIPSLLFFCKDSNGIKKLTKLFNIFQKWALNGKLTTFYWLNAQDSLHSLS